MDGGEGIPASEALAHATSRDEAAASRLPRFVALTGLRGVGCLIVVLGHSWTIVPLETSKRSGPLYGVFVSATLGVTIFMVLGSFLVTRSLTNEGNRTGSISVDRFWMRRVVRVGSQLYLLLAVLWIISWFDRWDTWNSEQHQRSLVTAGTFTLNWSLIDDPGRVRDDLGHLWYLSVEQQFYFVWLFVLAWFGRFRVLLITALAVCVVAVFVWRFRTIDIQGTWTASLRTSTRADGLLLGALAALAYPYVRTRSTAARWITVPCLITLGYLVYRSPKLDDYAFLETQGIVFAVVAALLVLAIAVAGKPRDPTERILSLPPLVLIGRISFPLFLWHYPVFWASSRWARDVDWFPRAVGSCAVLSCIVFVTYRWIERPVAHWLSGVRRDTIPTQTAPPAEVAVAS